MASKSFPDYVDPAPAWWESSLEDYQRQPAVAFLREAVHISDAMNQCRRHFPKKNDGTFNKDSQDSVYRLGAAALSTLMSHFETFQRSLFAGMIESTRLAPRFDINKCCQKLEKDASLQIDLARISGYRGQPAPIGQLIVDNLVGWHDPERVNVYFHTLVPDYQCYANDDIADLRTLWQLRHSVVHTGGWLTRPDAQKVPTLTTLAGKPILLNDNFITAAARRLHRLVARATAGLGAKFKAGLSPDLSPADKTAVAQLFKVKSPRRKWIPRGAV